LNRARRTRGTDRLAAIRAIRDVERFETLGEQIIDPAVNDWDTLLGSS
jgi:hypothetical protein